jgi:hypothetical protein
MSLDVLFAEIERLRAELNTLSPDKVDYEKILEVSRVLDELIVEYYRLAI